MDPDIANIQAEAKKYMDGLQRFLILNDITPPLVDQEITERQKKAWGKRAMPLMELGEMTATLQYDPPPQNVNVTITADEMTKLLNGETIEVSVLMLPGFKSGEFPVAEIKIIPKEISDELRDAQSGDGGQRDGQGHRGGSE